MPRLFFALPVPEECKPKLVSGFPQKKSHGVRMVPEVNLHITLHFLGDTKEDQVKDIIRQLQVVASDYGSFEMKFAGLKTILKERKPVMIWAQFEENAAFEQLSIALRKCFPTDEKRKPNPHLTLARIKQLKQLPFELPEVKPFSFMAAAVELWESKLGSEGATYSLIERQKLK